jgi:hypothetical protein
MAGALNDSISPAKYILTILCIFTRFVIAIPIASKSTHDVSEALFNYAFASHGRPLSVRSDEGKEFVNAGLPALHRRWNIDPITTGGWRPWANPVERYHRYLNVGMSLLSTKFILFSVTMLPFPDVLAIPPNFFSTDARLPFLKK